MDSDEELLRRLTGPLWYGEQDENGIDLSLIRANLRLSVTERMRKMDQARIGMMELRKNARILPRERP